jgi:phenylpropionate dioxygenase-like ring-hydroxylating dioxygenase large terminal subunit
MGTYSDFDGGQTAISFNPVSFLLASNDYAVIIRFTPVDALNTDAELIWIVHEEAKEGIDYDVNHMIEVWDITVKQDKTITENNQAGVLSKAYQPGSYSIQEARILTVNPWYLEQLESLVT